MLNEFASSVWFLTSFFGVLFATNNKHPDQIFPYFQIRFGKWNFQMSKINAQFNNVQKSIQKTKRAINKNHNNKNNHQTNKCTTYMEPKIQENIRPRTQI